MKEELIRIIVERLERDAEASREEFNKNRGVTAHSMAIDNLFPGAMAREIHNAFPPREEMHLLDNFREKKYTSKAFEKFEPSISEVIFAFQGQRMIDAVGQVTEQTFKRLVMTAAGYLRTAGRKIVKQGLAKKDLYESDKSEKK